MGFMDGNVIIPNHAGIGTDQASARIHECCLSLGASMGKREGRHLPAWVLHTRTPADPAEEGFHAYWCPYAQHETVSGLLGNGARFVFTARMDGCSFGIGSQTPAPVVSPTPTWVAMAGASIPRA